VTVGQFIDAHPVASLLAFMFAVVTLLVVTGVVQFEVRRGRDE